MNKQKMTLLVHQVAREKKLSFNTTLVYFFLEAVLRRIAHINGDLFIFKGGFILSNIIDITQRTTVDMDVLLKGYEMKQESVLKLLNEVVAVKVDDGVLCSVQSIEPIREQDDYGGFRIKILCQLENIKQIIPLDIATGDPITPAPVVYEYKTLFDNRKISLLSYNFETMLAEKLHTIFVRDLANSRSKDFYDVFMLIMLRRQEIAQERLRLACINTFNYRKTPLNTDELKDVIGRIENSTLMKNRWDSYTKSNGYAQGVSYQEAISACKQLVQMLEV